MGMVGNLLGGKGGQDGKGGGMAALGGLLNGMIVAGGGRRTNGKSEENENGGDMAGLGGLLNGMMGGKGGLRGKGEGGGKGADMACLGGVLSGIMGGRGGGGKGGIKGRRMRYQFSHPKQKVHCEKINDLFDLLKDLDFDTITPSNLSPLIEEHCACSSGSHRPHGNGTTQYWSRGGWGGTKVGNGTTRYLRRPARGGTKDVGDDSVGGGVESNGMGDGRGGRMRSGARMGGGRGGGGMFGGRMGGVVGSTAHITPLGGGKAGGGTCPPCECDSEDDIEADEESEDNEDGGFDLFDVLAG